MDGEIMTTDTEPGDERLAASLSVIGSPVRIALLRALRSPRRIAEIRIGAPEAGVPDRSRGSVLSRQTIKEHVERLVRIGVVVQRETAQGHTTAVEYVLNHQALYALSEEFRGLAQLRSNADLKEPTLKHPPHHSARDLQGPCLVLVKGLREGSVFQLTPPPEGPREWVIGRRRSADVPLDFDPFVSSENAVVTWDGEDYLVEDLQLSQNGTAVNFHPLPGGERHPLRTGDVIGVGRSLLLFRV